MIASPPRHILRYLDFIAEKTNIPQIKKIKILWGKPFIDKGRIDQEKIPAFYDIQYRYIAITPKYLRTKSFVKFTFLMHEVAHFLQFEEIDEGMKKFISRHAPHGRSFQHHFNSLRKGLGFKTVDELTKYDPGITYEKNGVRIPITIDVLYSAIIPMDFPIAKEIIEREGL